MADRLYIDGIEIELGSSEVVRTLQINDFGEVKNRQSNFSKTIKAPMTAKNIATFNFLGVTGNTSTRPYTTNVIKFISDGIELINEGKAVFNATTSTYDIVLYDGNVTLSTLLGNDTLADLDFTAYNHNLSVQHFLNNQTNTSGYVYAINRDADTPQIIDLNIVPPYFYIHTLIDMIFTQKNYSLSGVVLSDSDYQSRVTSMNSVVPQNYVESKVNEFNVPKTDGILDTVFTFAPQEYDRLSIDVDRGRTAGVYKIQINGSITEVVGFFGGFNIYVNSVQKAFISPNDVTKPVSLYLNDLDIADIKIIASGFDVGGGEYDIEITENYNIIVDKDSSYYGVDFTEIIGTTKQIDFVKDFFQRFNITFNKRRNEKVFDLIRSNDMLTDFDNSDDWSNKFGSFIKESYTSGYSQKNNLKHVYDASEDTFADGSFDVSNVNLSEEKTLLTSIFKASKQNGVPYVMEQYSYSEKDNVYTPKDDGLRIFKLNQSTFEISIAINNTDPYARVTQQFNTIVFQGLDYQTELDNNYGELISLLNNYKKIECEIDLNLIDIYQLSFFKLKYIKQLGGYFYLNKVSNFKKNKPTKVELIKIPV